MYSRDGRFDGLTAESDKVLFFPLFSQVAEILEVECLVIFPVVVHLFAPESIIFSFHFLILPFLRKYLNAVEGHPDPPAQNGEYCPEIVRGKKVEQDKKNAH